MQQLPADWLDHNGVLIPLEHQDTGLPRTSRR